MQTTQSRPLIVFLVIISFLAGIIGGIGGMAVLATSSSLQKSLGIKSDSGALSFPSQDKVENVTIKEDLGSNEYIANDPEIGKMRKQVHYYLAESNFDKLNLAKKPGLDDAKWFKLCDILDLNFYDDILPIITKGVEVLLGKEEQK